MLHFGIIEDRTSDPLMIGRVKVRVFGIHTPNRHELPTDDLPWALTMNSINTGAVDGIGFSPTGLLEGSTVVVMFADADQQIPIVLGSLNGIPLQSANPLNDNTDTSITTYKPAKSINSDAWSTTDGTVLTDSSGNPVQSSFALIDSLIPSEKCIALIKQFEGLASTSKTSKVIAPQGDSTPTDTLLYPYQDVGRLSIGWGSNFMADDSLVTKDIVITKGLADSLLLLMVHNKFARSVKRNLKVPVTQSMFDAVVSMGYNIGMGGAVNKDGSISGLQGTDFWNTLQSGKYKAASDLIPTTKISAGSGAITRRNAERALFLQDGIPADTKVSK